MDSEAALMELIDDIALRDESALKELYDAVFSRLYGLAIRVLGKTEWAEDA